jgi:hypothetical protein
VKKEQDPDMAPRIQVQDGVFDTRYWKKLDSAASTAGRLRLSRRESALGEGRMDDADRRQNHGRCGP